MTDHDVVIAGGGPTGLMLAAELTLADVDVVVVERRASQDLDGSRAGGLHSRTLEVLDQRGVAERFISEGTQHPPVGYAGLFLEVSDFPTRHNFVLALWQADFERIMAGWVDELGVPIRPPLRGRGLHAGRVRRRGRPLRPHVGPREVPRRMRRRTQRRPQGGRHRLPGLDASASWMIAEVQMDDEPQIGMRREGGGIGPVNREQGGNPYRVVLREPETEHSREPTLDDLRELLVALYGSDYGVHSPTWISRFTDMSRQAASYRNGRVLLAGDAAHVHPPQGGQGLNVGVQDAVNLGWKLAQVVHGTSPDSLLDTYHAERHPVGARVLHNTMAQSALGTADDRHQALRETMAELLAMDEPRKRFAGMLSGLDVHYDLGDGHPLLGRRMPTSN
jgi:3-(3-hydroxy-phenyl)propionate hydroxylase